MVNKNDFDLADNVDRLAIIFDEGVEVSSRIFVYYLIKLYDVSGFWVEVWYRQNSNTIDKIQRVEMEDVFHHYEKNIDISDLFIK